MIDFITLVTGLVLAVLGAVYILTPVLSRTLDQQPSEDLRDRNEGQKQ